MLRSYLKTAFRNIFKNRLSSIINILGLSAGMAMCMLIIVLVIDQNSYDNFHQNKDRIYRVISDRTSSSSSSFATTALPLYEELLNDQPAIEKATRLFNAGLDGDAKVDDKVLPISGVYADPSFFEIFDFELKYGDEKTALDAPFSIILTEEVTAKLGFGEENPVGESIEISDVGIYTITGVLEDPPGRTHIDFETLGSYSTVKALREAEVIRHSRDWTDTNNGFVYLMLQEGADPEDIAAAFPAISDREYSQVEGYRLDFRLQRLGAVTPSSLLENDLINTVPKEALLFLTILAILVLITAFFNYTNLSVARGLTRAKEVGVRKIVGARKIQIFMQFISEAVLVSLIALVFSFGLLEIVIIPQFGSLFFSRFFEMNLQLNWEVGLMFLGFSMLVGIIAGLLPAFYLSSFQPANVLKSLSSLKVFSGLGWRKILIIGQFAVALLFLITVTVLYQQSAFMLNHDYGFDQNNLVNVQLQGMDFQKFKEEVSRNSDIVQVSGSSLIPASGMNQATSYRLPDQQEDNMTHQILIDDQFIDNYGLELITGTNFRQQNDSTSSEVILNETAVKKMGWANPGEALGKAIFVDPDTEDPAASTIVGVVKDFHYMELERPIGTLLLRQVPQRIRYANLRIRSDNMKNTLESIESTWARLDPVHPIQYTFTDDAVGRIVNVYFDLLKILGFLSLVAIAICCLGLLGIAAYSVETRTKEIGIRKVLGASVNRIIWTLSRGLAYPLLIATIIAVPVAWYLNSMWLDSIAYHIPLTVFNIGLGVLIIGLIAGLIMVSQSLRIARRNPVESLRYE